MLRYERQGSAGANPSCTLSYILYSQQLRQSSDTACLVSGLLQTLLTLPTAAVPS